ncbi:protein RST1 isoform X2 [Amborella trichopoda]|uniref:protein RST1 isoform X2 n=1 Tax=Amborella trichopoda TaxID=13333 RepID=UPI0005D3D958|nr:protein RST1 isoform X2 [Amborella trichopoda]|eukprot:XP_011620613.1 protein RST1 isoform X2 [Amborella trichopoda]
MDTYGPLIQKIRVPQPSLQRLAVISIFRKLRSSASKLDFQSNTSRDALYNCLHCEELAVLDQTVRELCLLVKDGILEPHLAFQELLAGLEACNARSLSLFVKGIGLLCRIAVEKEPSWLIGPPDLHPFVKVFGCRVEVHNELIQQLILQILHMESLNSRDVVKFVRPFLMLTVLQASISSASSFFVRRLLSTLASLACSLSSEGLPIFKTLIESLKYFPWESSEDFACLIACAEDLVDAFEAILKQMAGSEELVNEAQALGTDLMDILLSYRYPWKLTIGIEPIMELSKRVVLIQKSYTLSYLPDFSAIVASLFCILIATEIEHEQLSILKLSTLLVKWRHESEYVRGRHGVCYGEELLFVLPITHLMVSPSKCIKDAAADLLHVLESVVVDLLSAPMNIALINEGPPSTSRPETVVRRLFRYLWLQDHSYSADVYCLLLTCKSQFKSNEIPDKMKSWLDQLRLYCLGSSGGLKSTSVFQLQDYQTRGMPSLLGAVASALVMHQTLGCPAIEALTAIGMMEPRLDVSLLLVTLFYSKILCTNLSNSNEVLVKLLGMLPSLASHSSMVPLIIQTILPMLHRDAKPILIATSVRLLSKTWEVSDRVFAHLRGALLPTAFADSASERDLGISLAASVRDVCKKDADRGVDIILSVSACIESKVSTVQALGLESLGHLCEADVVDFYTAWDVIQQHLLDYSKDPIVACSLCILLRWAATDVEAYPEPSKSILQILVEIATSRHIGYGDRWVKARVSAFKSLNHYEVGHIQQTIPDFLSQKVDWLLSESDPQVLRAIEELEIKIMAYEHVNRRRFGREKKLLVKKVEKLLSVLPQVFFSSGHRDTAVGIYPGTALFCLAFPVPKYHQGRGMQKELQKFQDVYEGVVTEITVTLNLSRNIVFALLAIQSWQIFMSRWIRAIMLFDTEELFGTNERRSTMAADCILKVLCRIAEGSIPRAAENIALAIGSLCMVLPHPAHSIISIASMFLLDWLHQHEHEYKQWPAAISLGLVSGCLHGTDWEKKFHIVNTLLKVLYGSNNSLVQGACGVGLGFTCLDLFARNEVGNDLGIDEGNYKMKEVELLRMIVRALARMIALMCPSNMAVKDLCQYNPIGVGHFQEEKEAVGSAGASCKNLKDDVWGGAGLIIGLGSCVPAIYRSGDHKTVLKIKQILMSWIPHVNVNIHSYENVPMLSLSVGSCLALPTIVALCQRAEMGDDNLDPLVIGYRELISELSKVNKFGTSHQNLTMASCIGAGNLISCILDEGVYPIRVELIKSLLEMMRDAYMKPNSPCVHLGGMFGVVNALGAGAGLLTRTSSWFCSQIDSNEIASSYINGPILSSPICEPLSTSLMQEIFLVARESENQEMRSSAAWSMSFLRNRWLSRDLPAVNSFQSYPVDSKPVSQNFPEDSAVWKFCLWLIDLNFSKMSTSAPANTVASVLRCLARAPRLPSALDWGIIIRRCMKYGDHASINHNSDQSLERGTVRVECLALSFAHAQHVIPLLCFLDELFELARFQLLEVPLKSFLLAHLVDMMKLLSKSRMEKLYNGMFEFFSSPSSSYMDYDPNTKKSLRASFWKGLQICPSGPIGTTLSLSILDKCLDSMFVLLPPWPSDDCDQEWSEAITCLGQAQQEWLVNILLVQETDSTLGKLSNEAAKRIFLRARLVMNDRSPLSELMKLLPYVLNKDSDGFWRVLLEVAAAVQCAEISIKQQWLIDTIDIGCITEYPSTALRFLGLLSSCWCHYAVVLISNPDSVLRDLPVTLPSLFLSGAWKPVVEALAAKLWAFLERIHGWAAHLEGGDKEKFQGSIDKSQESMSSFLLLVLHATCIHLKDYLPFELQLRLASMEIV